MRELGKSGKSKWNYMKTNLWKFVVGGLFSLMLLTASPSQACPTCPPDPCHECPPDDESVPFDSGLALVLLGAVALGATKVYGWREIRKV
jgi:hypothetical protein